MQICHWYSFGLQGYKNLESKSVFLGGGNIENYCFPVNVCSNSNIFVCSNSNSCAFQRHENLFTAKMSSGRSKRNFLWKRERVRVFPFDLDFHNQIK